MGNTVSGIDLTGMLAAFNAIPKEKRLQISRDMGASHLLLHRVQVLKQGYVDKRTGDIVLVKKTAITKELKRLIDGLPIGGMKCYFETKKRAS